MVEFDFQTVYSIYKNLAVMVCVSALFPDFDGKMWARSGNMYIKPGVDKLRFSNIYNVNCVFHYTF